MGLVVFTYHAGPCLSRSRSLEPHANLNSANCHCRLGLTHLIGTQALKPYMHGYFLSLKLYTTARLVANPTSYAEHREKVVADRLAAKAESRIRARKDQPKVNKVLAERLRRADERAEALEQRKRAQRAAANGQDVEQDGGGEAKEKEGVSNDPRFKELFENPEFEVDEDSREFALLNPATANKNVSCSEILPRFAHGDVDLWSQASRKTAVQEEDDDSDLLSSGLEEDEDDDSKEGSDDLDGQHEGSDESSEESDEGSESSLINLACLLSDLELRSVAI